MKIHNHHYSDTASMLTFIKENNIPNSAGVLLQIFSGIIDKKLLLDVMHDIRAALPKINIIGSTSFSEISDGRILKHKIVLSFSVFENTDIKTAYIKDASFESGVRTAGELITNRSRCMIIFSEALKTNCVPFIQGVQHKNSSLIMAGGNAADDYTFTETFIMHDKDIYSEGICIALLDSDVLRLHNDCALNWNPFGKSFTVTKTNGNVICELDNQPIADIIGHYFGKQAVENVPASLIEFPLLKEVEDTLVARSTIAVTDEGYLYAGDFKEGDIVRFGVGDIENMHNNALSTIKKLENKPIEGIYIYSCTARYTFLGSAMDIEIEMLNHVADTAGFFTYGEIYHTGTTNQILNLTTTFLSLSETANRPQVTKPKPQKEQQRGMMLKYLTNFINTMTLELEENLNSIQSYKNILDETTIVSKTDLRGKITYVNEAFCAVSEYTPEEVLNKPHSIVKHPETPLEAHQMMWNTITSGKVWKGIIKNRTKTGKTVYLDTIIMPIKDKNGKIFEYMSVRHDMTKIIRQEQLINEQLTDNLTKLPNRIKLFDDLQNNQVDLLAILNIDGFKGINDLYGFDIADQLLIQLTAFMRNKLNQNMSLYRIGGDVFVVTCNHCLKELFREKIINMLTDINKTIFRCGEYDVDVSMTSGIAYDTNRLLTSAEVALRNAKKNGLIMSEITKDSPEANIYLENTRWLRTVKEALTSGNIINFYQPIINLEDPSEQKFEALVRLRDSEGTIHSPFAFLDVIKQTSEYEQLTKTVILNVYNACCKYDYHFALNLSAQDIKNSSTMQYLKEVLSMNDVAKRITLEITESEAIVDYNFVNAFIDDFKNMGCKIAIDDFGSGYSNFAYLTQFNVDYLKIDGSIIKRVMQDKNALITLESILDFARRLGVKTVAEFVSDEDIYHKMRELGVNYVQGYYLGKPAPLK